MTIENEKVGLKKKYFTQHNEEVKHHELTTGQKEVFELAARGLADNKIARVLSRRYGQKMNVTAVEEKMKKIRRNLGANNRLNAVMIGVNEKIISLSRATKNLNKNSLSILTRKEEDVLEKVIDGDGRYSDEEIARSLNINYSALTARFNSIYSKTNLNRIRATLLYMKYPKTSMENLYQGYTLKEKTVLTFVGKGLTNKEIADILPSENGLKLRGYQVEKILQKFSHHWGTKNRLNAVLIGIKKGILDLNELTENYDMNLLINLLEPEKKVLESILKNDGRDITDRKIAENLNTSGENMTPGLVRVKIESITKKLELIRTQSVLLYLAGKLRGQEDLSSNHTSEMNSGASNLPEESEPEEDVIVSTYSVRAQRFLDSGVIFKRNL